MYVRAPTSFRTAHEDDIDWLCIGEVLWQLGDIYCMCCQLILWDLFGSCMMCARTRVCVCAGFLSQSTPQRIPIIHRWHRGNLLGTFLCIFQQCLKPRKKTVMCVFSTQQQCVRVFYAFFFLIVKIDSSSIPLINEIAGKKNQSVTCRSMEITVHCRDAPHGNGNLDLAPGWIKVVAWPPLIKIFLDL